jgi:hypothetical protein
VTLHPITSHPPGGIPLILGEFSELIFSNWKRGGEIVVVFFAGNDTLTSALEPNRACAVARPTKQDSASGRSDSSSAIQSQETQSKWNKVL